MADRIIAIIQRWIVGRAFIWTWAVLALAYYARFIWLAKSPHSPDDRVFDLIELVLAASPPIILLYGFYAMRRVYHSRDDNEADYWSIKVMWALFPIFLLTWAFLAAK